MDIRAAEISQILKDQIANLATEAEVDTNTALDHIEPVDLVDAHREAMRRVAMWHDMRKVFPTDATRVDVLVDPKLGETEFDRSLLELMRQGASIGEAALELRALDQKLADVFLKILDWWRGPTQSDEPLFTLLGKLEDQFSTPAEASRQ